MQPTHCPGTACPAAGEPVELRNMWDVYCRFYLPFGELLTDMEAAGMAVDM